MFCPACGSESVRCVRAHRYNTCIKRERSCRGCGTQWTTREEVEFVEYRNPSTNQLEKVTVEQFKKVIDYHIGRKRHPDVDLEW